MIDVLWVTLSASLVFLMQAGFLCLESGLTRSKNNINVALKNVADLGVSILLFWGFGFALMFGMSQSGIVGSSGFLPDFATATASASAFFVFHAMFCGTTVTILSGAVAERMRFASYIIVAILVSGLIYPVYGHWAWNGLDTGEALGWLGKAGFVDFAGSTVVHSVGGWVALVALFVVGPRTGRFSADGSARTIPGSNLPVAMLGVLLLWFGWIGFNGGSTLAMNDQVPGIVANTMIAAAAGLVTALSIGWYREGRVPASCVMNGSLAGLVAITAGCHAVSTPAAAFIGAVGGMVMLVTEHVLERARIDDAVGAVPVHLGAGIWGTLAVALFGSPEILATGLDRWEQLIVQMTGIAVCGAWTFGVAFVVLRGINRMIPLRVTEQDEHKGLNVVEHGATTEAYELFAVMEEQARTGDLSLRVPVEPFTEIGQIAERYNRIMEGFERSLVRNDELQLAKNELQEVSNILAREKEKLQAEVLDRIHAQQGLADKVAQLARKNEELDEFTYVASHDLQEPLRKLVSFSELLKEDIGTEMPDEAAKDLDFIQDAARRMRHLVQDLLVLSRAGRAAAKHEPVRLAECVGDALSALSIRVQETDAEITIDELPEVLGDRTVLTQLFQNLIGNALKFVETAQPAIHITAEKGESDIWTIGICDNGIGIAPEYVTQIFAPFKRLLGRDEYEGTGIGLAICRKGVEQHGGKIWVDSEPGHGAQFKFTIADRAVTDSVQGALET